MSPEIYKPEYHKKAWGAELWLRNNDKYCGKILRFNKGAKFSLHFHVKKEETWYIQSGQFLLTYINTNDATKIERILNKGEVIHIKQGMPHQLKAIDEGEVVEVSTQHDEADSYRVEAGDSQLVKFQ